MFLKLKVAEIVRCVKINKAIFLNTSHFTTTETAKLHQDLQKVEQLDTKISTELDSLKKKIVTMTSELETYSDIDKLKSDAGAKKQASISSRIGSLQYFPYFKKSFPM